MSDVSLCASFAALPSPNFESQTFQEDSPFKKLACHDNHLRYGNPVLWNPSDNVVQTIHANKHKLNGDIIYNSTLQKPPFKNGTGIRGSFSCDACNKTFSEKEEFDQHLAQHVECCIGGCLFKAHPKIVALHRKMQHDTGLAKKIMSLDTPEDVTKWRAERRRNFPTAKNIARRKAEEAEKEARGEVLKTKEFGKMQGGAARGRGGGKHYFRSNSQKDVPSKNSKDGNADVQRGRRGRRRNNRRSRTPKNCNVTGSVALEKRNLDESDEDIDRKGTLKKFRGTFFDYKQYDESAEILLCNGATSNCALQTPVSNKCFGGELIELADVAGNSETKVAAVDDNKQSIKNGTVIEHFSGADLIETQIQRNAAKDNVEVLENRQNINIEVQDNIEKEEGELTDSDTENMVTSLENEDNTICKDPSLLSEICQKHYQNSSLRGLVHLDRDDVASAPLSLPIQKLASPETRLASQLGGSLGLLMSSYADSDSENEEQRDAGDHSGKNCSKKILKKLVNSFPIHRKHSTLLEKLLSKEIRHERNVILQCVRYVVKKEFFKIRRDDS